MTARMEWPWRPVKGYAHGDEQRDRDLREDDGLMAVTALRSMSQISVLALTLDEAVAADTLADRILRRLSNQAEAPSGGLAATDGTSSPRVGDDGDRYARAESQRETSVPAEWHLQRPGLLGHLLHRLHHRLGVLAGEIECPTVVPKLVRGHGSPSSASSTACGAGSVGAADDRRPVNDQTDGPER